MNDGVLAISDAANIQKAFGATLRSHPKAIALSEEDVSKDGRIQSLLRRALIRADKFKIETDDVRRLWEADA
jgi:hypothetical protein